MTRVRGTDIISILIDDAEPAMDKLDYCPKTLWYLKKLVDMNPWVYHIVLLFII
jgi:hypothetical protein